MKQASIAWLLDGVGVTPQFLPNAVRHFAGSEAMKALQPAAMQYLTKRRQV